MRGKKKNNVSANEQAQHAILLRVYEASTGLMWDPTGKRLIEVPLIPCPVQKRSKRSNNNNNEIFKAVWLLQSRFLQTTNNVQMDLIGLRVRQDVSRVPFLK